LQKYIKVTNYTQTDTILPKTGKARAVKAPFIAEKNARFYSRCDTFC